MTGCPCTKCDCTDYVRESVSRCVCSHLAWEHDGDTLRSASQTAVSQPRQTAAIRPATKQCPDCAEQVQSQARVCKHCGHHFSGSPSTKQPRTSGTATASLVFSVLWIGGIGSAIAIVCGHRARTEMRRDTSIRGNGLAVAGLILGYVLGIPTVLFWFSGILVAMDVIK